MLLQPITTDENDDKKNKRCKIELMTLDKGLVQKVCEQNCPFVDLLMFVIALFRHHA